MIDTVVLFLSRDKYHISEPDKFEPSAQWALDNNHRPIGFQSKQNPTKKELLNGIYKPRLTLAHRINSKTEAEIMLKIELSLPKLFFGNNFNELMSKDLDPLLEKLSLTLKEMGAIVSSKNLLKAPVSVIHYSKNIPLTDGSTPYHYINKIKEANIKLSLDVNQTDYRNDGYSYKWHSNSYEIVFYDKIRDLEKAKISDKRALEKDNAIQLNLFEQFKQRKNLEFLRMEVRLNKRQKIKQVLNALNIDSDLTLKSLFKTTISQKVLLYYLGELENRRSVLMDYKASNDKALLSDLVFNNPDLGPKQILQIYGFKKALEIVNTRELRAMFMNHNQRSWYRFMSEINQTILPNQQNFLGIIKKNIVKYKACKIKI